MGGLAVLYIRNRTKEVRIQDNNIRMNNSKELGLSESLESMDGKMPY